MKKNINILVTCMGGRYTYDLISAIKSAKGFNANIYGADSSSSMKILYIKKLYKIPRPSDKNLYLKKIFSICKNNNIKTIFPGSENETILLSKNKERFKKKNINILVSNYKTVLSLNDKGSLFNILQKKNFDIGKWELVNSEKNLKKIVKKIGYPSKKIVLKQRRGSGSRGVIILDSKLKKFKYLLKNRFCGTGDFNSTKKEFRKRKIKFNNLICMPYYDGDTYDVDCLAFNGNAQIIIPRLRQYENPLSPYNEGCILKNNLKIKNYIKKIIDIFKIHGVCDFDVVMDKAGNPKLLDSSNRMSGSVGASFVAGYNLPEQAIKYILGMKTKKIFPNKKSRLIPVNKFVLI